MSADPLPPVTLAIEWANARDTAPGCVGRQMEALQSELQRCEGRFSEQPVVLYLHAGDCEAEIRRELASHGTKLADLAELRIVAIAGADYLGLKRAGVGLARTGITLFSDCDVEPQKGWLTELLAPFADPDVVAAAGFTHIAVDGMLSKVCALAWVYHLPSEADLPLRRNRVYANNFAVRSEYFRAHPWLAPAGGKKGGTPFLREVERNGKRWARVTRARMLHPPHRSAWRFVQRGWEAGHDQDWVARQKGDSTRLGRVKEAFHHFKVNARRVLPRLVTKRRDVSLPLWQVPAALCLALAHWTATLVAELSRAVRR